MAKAAASIVKQPGTTTVINPLHNPPQTGIDKRFVSINFSDLLLCPTLLLRAIEKMRFVHHLDFATPPGERGRRAGIQHEDEWKKRCRCWRECFRLNKRTQNHVLAPESSTAEKPANGQAIYQFFAFTARRIKSESLLEATPEKPSAAVLEFCLGQAMNKGNPISYPVQESSCFPPNLKTMQNGQPPVLLAGSPLVSSAGSANAKKRKRRDISTGDTLQTKELRKS